MNKKVIFVHGYHSSPKKLKYQLVAKELKKLGVDFIIPQFPGKDHPQSSKWLEIINKQVKSANKPVVLVGHSLGTRAILLYLDKYNQKVDRVILIAAFNNEIEKNGKMARGRLSNFFQYHLDIKKITKLARKFIVVHSEDDDLIPYRQGVGIAKELGAKLITYKDKGHFSGRENSATNADIFIDVIKSVL